MFTSGSKIHHPTRLISCMRRMLTAMDGRKTINEKRDSISASSLYGNKIPSMNPVTNEPISVNSIKYQNYDMLALPEKLT